MTTIKLQRAFTACGIASMRVTREAIQSELDKEAIALKDLSSTQLAAVIRLIQSNYHKGRASTGAEIVDDAVWIGGDINQLIDLADIKKLAAASA